MFLKEHRVKVYVTDSFSVDGYICSCLGDDYLVLESIEIPCKVVVHRSWIDNAVVRLPSALSSWVMSQMGLSLPLPMEFFDA
jgi:hypothetical protein